MFICKLLFCAIFCGTDFYSEFLIHAQSPIYVSIICSEKILCLYTNTILFGCYLLFSGMDAFQGSIVKCRSNISLMADLSAHQVKRVGTVTTELGTHTARVCCYSSMYIYIYIFLCVCVCVCMYVCVCVCIYIYIMCVYIYIYIYIYTHTHTHTHTHTNVYSFIHSAWVLTQL